MSMGTLSWFHNVSADHGDVIEYGTIFFPKNSFKSKPLWGFKMILFCFCLFWGLPK